MCLFVGLVCLCDSALLIVGVLILVLWCLFASCGLSPACGVCLLFGYFGDLSLNSCVGWLFWMSILRVLMLY